MRSGMIFLSMVVLAAWTVSFAQQKGKETQATEAGPAPIPSEEAAKKIPVKPTPEGLAEAKRLYGYHCAMCHGKEEDGKGDLAEEMKLDLHDWRNASSISKMTDGGLFYVITNGRGKMLGGECDRTKEEVRWNLVSLVRSFGKNRPEEAAKP